MPGATAPMSVQEVKQAKARRSNGYPPRAVQAHAPVCGQKRAAPDAEADAAGAVAASSLPWLPPGCTWGYRTPDGCFVPFDPVTKVQGAPGRVRPSTAPQGDSPERMRPRRSTCWLAVASGGIA